jgi:hypothetical protein
MQSFCMSANCMSAKTLGCPGGSPLHDGKFIARELGIDYPAAFEQSRTISDELTVDAGTNCDNDGPMLLIGLNGRTRCLPSKPLSEV